MDHVAQMALEIIAGFAESVESSTGAPSLITIRMRRCSGRSEQAAMRPHQRFAVDVFLQQTLAHHQAKIAPRAPPRRIRAFVDHVTQIIEPPGCGGRSAFSQASFEEPPFHAIVVKPRISTFTPQRSSVRARISAHRAPPP
jgi:hypothetical protein